MAVLAHLAEIRSVRKALLQHARRQQVARESAIDEDDHRHACAQGELDLEEDVLRGPGCPPRQNGDHAVAAAAIVLKLGFADRLRGRVEVDHHLFGLLDERAEMPVHVSVLVAVAVGPIDDVHRSFADEAALPASIRVAGRGS